jgi:lysozyme family protein|tara:strand:+ start:118 stop:663 length:546 start_codon:yes stop_codon:yes gene_type:complete
MITLKEGTIKHIIDVEGGYANDPNDSGGETNWGVTVRVARKYGYTSAMIDMPRSVAFDIYSAMYWDKLSLDDVEDYSQIIAKELADTGVNMGTGRAAEFLQRSLNALNNQGKLFEDLVVDRDLGPATLLALSAFLAKRGERGEVVLYRALNCLQGAFYIELSERREKDERFVFGWLENRVN